MSRLIVKNLPNGLKEDRFRSMFAAFGTLTDCCLKFTADGKFRKFGFVGFRSEQEAEKALQHFNKSFIDTSRITVEHCKSFGDLTKAKPWSKHSQKPSVGSATVRESVKPTKKQPSEDKTNELDASTEFQEFVAVHKNRTQAPAWANDNLTTLKTGPTKEAAASDYLNFDSDSEEKSDEDEDTQVNADSNSSKAKSTALSDMQYLRTKVVKTVEESDSDTENESDSEQDDEKEKLVPEKESESGKGAPSVVKPEKKTAGSKAKQQMAPTTLYTVKLRGAPFNVTEEQVREFFTPLKPADIRIVRNNHGNKTGCIYVDFKSEDEIKKAMQRNKDYMGGRYIEIFAASAPKHSGAGKHQSKPTEFSRNLKEDEEEEDLAESGRIFVRNLPYTCSEEDVSNLFSKYGHISEIHFPIDHLTKKPKGFAFVTFMIPENAVQAFAELDGHVFQGRMIHLIPSTIKKEKAEETLGNLAVSSYKKQKALKEKATSGSSHNWNTLFLGTNAVVDVIAEKYNTTKIQVLDHEAKGSMAVRVALGETQIVQETRQFLLDNKVSLDSFSQASGPRSKTVLLVKNLPAGVQLSELEAVFGRFGTLGRVLLPPAGLTALVEFLEPTEAKHTFTKLAYTKFQHVPLYLEWAPVDVFSEPYQRPHDKEKPGIAQGAEESEKKTEEVARGESVEDQEEKEEEEEEEEESLPGCTLFIKNLNFSTTEDVLKKTFSKCGVIKSCTISKKKDRSGNLLSMGYGFVEYKKPESAQKALRQLQHCQVDDHQLEVKLSERATKPTVVSTKKKQTAKKQTSSKILVRNIPFQATVREIRELFSTFGELKTVRLPKKMSGTGPHRGFGFVDFLTKQDAKKAFTALCHSTHLYGRRLVLEWADSEETVETLRRKTAEHFHDTVKKKKHSEVMEDIMEQNGGGS
ncbi:LOW QUALITY PROTEIN: probable RNA-binding protein 19 [Erpetoichthys calabaricus]|uniref:LOW QUALITY PROTEIN: probable RNA-binding protein 19 n=1 Tax=Erpetoichthys calabaricus TaxID=27687 RepID=UPI002234918B|nr:LOW QUALITY PROTEIN: probable RNA-binding protein 19 [Erpetoichthys calabaricus]